jgi:dUTP pyrophosphatase
MLKFKPHKQGGKMYEVGERIGQIIIMPYPQIEFKEVEELSETNRGDGGFGSTGK